MAIRDLTSGSVTELDATRLDSAIGIDRDPDWSPDGTQVVFATSTSGTDGAENGSTISVIKADGSGLRRLVPVELLAGDPDWSPDGEVILFSTRPIHTFDVSGPSEMQLYTVRPDGSEVRALLDTGVSGAASWSADGSQILFTGITGFEPGAVPGLGAARPNMMVMERDGTGIQPLTAFRTCCRWYAVQQPMP